MYKQGSNLDTLTLKVQEYLSHVHFDTQTCTSIPKKINEDYIIKLISKLVVSMCSTWYAIQEILDFLRKRKEIKGFTT